MQPDLRKSHQANDKAVLAVYGFSKRYYGNGDCGTADADVSGNGEVVTGKTETAEHAPLSYSKSCHFDRAQASGEIYRGKRDRFLQIFVII